LIICGRCFSILMGNAKGPGRGTLLGMYCVSPLIYPWHFGQVLIIVSLSPWKHSQ
jgi:hypothetical protein